eukprot:gene2921-3208_t
MSEDEVYYDVLSDEDTNSPADIQEPQVYEGAYPLHRAAFHNDGPRLTALLNKLSGTEICDFDCHGNNALHVAALRGSTTAVQVLLEAGLPAASRNSRGWTALDEALAAKALATARLLQQKLLADAKAELKQKRAQLLESMKAMPDYSLQLQWQLGSSVPGLGLLLRRYAPHDTYTIWKAGDRLRVDGTLMGLDTKNIMPQWKRGHFSLIWWIDLSADKKILKLEGKGEEEELEEELALAMERDVDKVRLKPRNFTFAPVRGWLGGPFTEKVEGWRCQVYEATGKKPQLKVNLLPGNIDAVFEDYLAAEYEADAVKETFIDPVAPPGMSNSRTDMHHSQASTSAAAAGDAEDEEQFDDQDHRKAVPGSNSKHSGIRARRAGSAVDHSGAVGSDGGRLLKARCWMAEDFPMHLSQLLPLLDVIGTANKHMAKVGKFLSKYSQMDMFPVKLQVPLLLTVHVLVGFKAFQPLVPGSSHPPPPADFFDVPLHFRRRLLQDAMDKAAAGMLGVRGRRQPRHTAGKDLDEYDLDPAAAAADDDNLGVLDDDDGDNDSDETDTADLAGSERQHPHVMLLGGEDGGAGDDELLVWAESSSAASEDTKAKQLGTAESADSSIGASTRAVERAAADVERQMLAEVADDTSSSLSGSGVAGRQAEGQAAAAAAKHPDIKQRCQKKRGLFSKLRRIFRRKKKQ